MSGQIPAAGCRCQTGAGQQRAPRSTGAGLVRAAVRTRSAERGARDERREQGRQLGWEGRGACRTAGAGRARSSGICGRVRGRARGGAARRSGGAGEQGRRRWGRGIRHRSRTCIDHRESSGRRGGERLQQERGLGCARTQSTKEPPSAPSRRDQQIGEVSRRGADPGHPGESHDPGRWCCRGANVLNRPPQ